ncbi:hypothetical protein [Pseudarthrobacter sp. AB1]|uniref:hypothetical protein n=1 Tax=Pseudarthrobacter sp. AB1 TaxID=2138309 RepID=UPI00186B943D|nr:hypothetical protein [Pseudarthrobacter sp. AB1]MBE4719520.1 hypothetical protein [Pseudarthrobacter sp. AB1]
MTAAWEDGTVTLPSSDFTALRRSLESAEKDLQDRTYELTQQCWRGIPRREQDRPREYRAAVEMFLEDRTADNRRTTRGPMRSVTLVIDPWEELAIIEARKLLGSPGNYVKPARVQKGDLEFANNRTTEFAAHESAISFDREKRTVSWRIRSQFAPLADSLGHPLMQLMTGALEALRWTSETGGYVERSGEIIRAYGPLGAEAYPDLCLPYITSRGEQVTQADLDRKRSIQSRMAA